MLIFRSLWLERNARLFNEESLRVHRLMDDVLRE
jgi:hypothetical protein